MTTTKFGWASGSRLSGKVSADVAGNQLAAIKEKHGGILTPEAVVDDARPKGSPLHPVFEWNDKRAGEKYRVIQAREVIRAVVLVPEEANEDEKPQPVRAFVCVSAPPELEDTRVNVFRSIEDALNDPGMRQEVIGRALGELRAFQRKYRTLQELSPVFDAIASVAGAREAEAAE